MAKINLTEKQEKTLRQLSKNAGTAKYSRLITKNIEIGGTGHFPVDSSVVDLFKKHSRNAHPITIF